MNSKQVEKIGDKILSSDQASNFIEYLIKRFSESNIENAVQAVVWLDQCVKFLDQRADRISSEIKYVLPADTCKHQLELVDCRTEFDKAVQQACVIAQYSCKVCGKSQYKYLYGKEGHEFLDKNKDKLG